MIVVSDTTALTTLIKAGLEHLLPGLFGEIRIPQAVAKELLQFHSALPTWCQTEFAKEGPVLDALRIGVDAGEAEAIALALDLKADFVLLDDKKGRRQADALGLACLALPALMVAAKRQGLIRSVPKPSKSSPPKAGTELLSLPLRFCYVLLARLELQVRLPRLA